MMGSIAPTGAEDAKAAFNTNIPAITVKYHFLVMEKFYGCITHNVQSTLKNRVERSGLRTLGWTGSSIPISTRKGLTSNVYSTMVVVGSESRPEARPFSCLTRAESEARAPTVPDPSLGIEHFGCILLAPYELGHWECLWRGGP